MSDINDLSAMGNVLDSAIADLNRLTESMQRDREQREREALYEMVKAHGADHVHTLLAEIEVEVDAENAEGHDDVLLAADTVDHYLDDPRRGQAAAINKGEF